MNTYQQELENLRRENRDAWKIMELKNLLAEARKILLERAVYYHADEAKGDGAYIVQRIDRALL